MEVTDALRYEPARTIPAAERAAQHAREGRAGDRGVAATDTQLAGTFAISSSMLDMRRGFTYQSRSVRRRLTKPLGISAQRLVHARLPTAPRGAIRGQHRTLDPQ